MIEEKELDALLAKRIKVSPEMAEQIKAMIEKDGGSFETKLKCIVSTNAHYLVTFGTIDVSYQTRAINEATGLDLPNGDAVFAASFLTAAYTLIKDMLDGGTEERLIFQIQELSETLAPHVHKSVHMIIDKLDSMSQEDLKASGDGIGVINGQTGEIMLPRKPN